MICWPTYAPAYPINFVSTVTFHICIQIRNRLGYSIYTIPHIKILLFRSDCVPVIYEQQELWPCSFRDSLTESVHCAPCTHVKPAARAHVSDQT
jgi:hypothetical protein